MVYVKEKEKAICKSSILSSWLGRLLYSIYIIRSLFRGSRCGKEGVVRRPGLRDSVRLSLEIIKSLGACPLGH